MFQQLRRQVGALLACTSVALAPTSLTLAATAESGIKPASVVAPEEIIVVATRTPARLFDVPYSAFRIDQDDVARASYRTLPQALRDLPGVMVQETSLGQGSPYIRGFTGYHNLLLVDGVRVNNAIFREGANQYWAGVDLSGIERLEIVQGAAATRYGSDAIGGTVNAVTGNALSPSTRAAVRQSSAEHSTTARIEAGTAIGSGAGGRFGVTARNFGALEGGRSVGTQHGVGYEQHAVDVKLAGRVGNGWLLEALLQRDRLEDAPRTHRTLLAPSWQNTALGTERRHEFDQTRQLDYLRATREVPFGAIDSASVTLSASGMHETRDRIRGNGVRDLQGFDIESIGLTTQLASASPLGDLIYGFECYWSQTDTFSSTNAIQGPVADDADYDTCDAFIQDDVRLTDGTRLLLAARHARVTLDARHVIDPLTNGRMRIRDDWSATVGSVALQHDVIADRLTAFGGVAQGFRAPNLSDVSRFDNARTNEFEVPSAGLRPEKFLSFEAGLKWRGEQSNGSAAWFTTHIDDLIQRAPNGRRRGADFEVTKANSGDGWVRGIQLAADYRLTTRLHAFGTFTWMDSSVSAFPTSAPVAQHDPIDRQMPTTSALGLRYTADAQRWWLEGRMVHAARADELSAADARDTSRIPPGGTPGYTVANVGGGYRFGNGIALTLNVDNLTNEDYRIHGSGTNMPGRNVIVAIDWRHR